MEKSIKATVTYSPPVPQQIRVGIIHAPVAKQEIQVVASAPTRQPSAATRGAFIVQALGQLERMQQRYAAIDELAPLFKDIAAAVAKYKKSE